MLKKLLKCQYGPTNTYSITSPLGLLEVVSCPHGLHSLSLPNEMTDVTFTPDTSIDVKIKDQRFPDNGYTYKPALQCVSWLQDFFTSGCAESGLPPICFFQNRKGTDPGASFTYRVWRALAEQVPYGQTISYRDLAKLSGNEKASRAVGQAMRNNPVVLIIPCHRVILSSGEQGNYSRGRINSVKAWLINHEASSGCHRK